MIANLSHKGFTLIEIAVVVMLIGIMLVFTVPRLPDDLLTDPIKKTSRWLIFTVQNLKDRAVRENTTYSLHIEIDKDRFWITDASMSEEDQQAAEAGAFQLPDGIDIMDVAYPDMEKRLSGRAVVSFFKQGYSERAMIHLQTEDGRLTYQVEPFLSKLKYHESYIGFED
jgi:prepilin-type N-terminal cleavage/methylation domain-containing protein